MTGAGAPTAPAWSCAPRWLAVADAIAATADLARAKDSREPVVILDGLERFVTDEDGPGAVASAAAAGRGSVPLESGELRSPTCRSSREAVTEYVSRTPG